VHRSPDDAGSFEVVVADKGGGIPRAKMETLFHWFSTSSKLESADNYGYSRNHGSQFTGIGVGVNMARLYCAAMGGSVRWSSDEVGTTATVTLPMKALKI
jgi:signal transduction histidine kinase